jgi:hypothetical protein
MQASPSRRLPVLAQSGSVTAARWLAKVRESPGLVEDRGFGAVEPEEDLEILLWERRDPVAWVPVRGLRAEKEVDRSVAVGDKVGALRRAAGPGHLAEKRVCLAVVRIADQYWVTGASAGTWNA